MPTKRFLAAACIYLLSVVAAAQGVITTLVGTDWVFPSSSGPAIDAPLGLTIEVAIDRAGNVYGSDCDNHFIFKVDTTGALSIAACNGLIGFGGWPCRWVATQLPSGAGIRWRG